MLPRRRRFAQYANRRLPKATDPLTGGKASDHEVIAVKVENIAAARPQVGLSSADIIFVEEVEGAQTRLVAVYHSALPVPAGSGPQRPEHRRPTAAALRQARPGLFGRQHAGSSADRPIASIVPIARSTRDNRRVAPHNVFVDLDQIARTTTVGRPAPSAGPSILTIPTAPGDQDHVCGRQRHVHLQVRQVGSIPVSAGRVRPMPTATPGS